jgi:hypothetical protein
MQQRVNLDTYAAIRNLGATTRHSGLQQRSIDRVRKRAMGLRPSQRHA